MNPHLWIWIVCTMCGIVPTAVVQAGEIYIPGLSPNEMNTSMSKEAVKVPVQNGLASCLASPSLDSCASVAIGNQFESTAFPGGENLFESMVVNLDDGSVYSAPVVAKAKDMPQNQLIVAAVSVAIEFDFNDSTIRSDQQVKIQQLKIALADKVNAKNSFAIVGHTDVKGSDTYNCRLSKARARSVSYALTGSIASDRLKSTGAGEFLLKNQSYGEAAENRRVTFVLLDAAGLKFLAGASRLCE